MLPQDEIDAVLGEAQSAVNDLAQNVEELAGSGEAGGAATAAAAEDVNSESRGGGCTVGDGGSGMAAPGRGPVRLGADAVSRILKLKVPVVVRLAERPMLLSEIMKMMPGTILEFSRMVDEDLDLLVNNQQIGSGVAVKVSERFGLKVTFVGDIRRRVNSLRAS